MKKGIAWILILLLIFTAGFGTAEDPDRTDTADIQNSLITDENRDQDKAGLHEIIQLISQLSQDQQLSDLLNMEDVKNIVAEGMMKATMWLIENPDVAVKVMVELGLKQETAEAVGVLLKRMNEKDLIDIDSLDEKDQDTIRDARMTIAMQLLNGLEGLTESDLDMLKDTLKQILTGGNRNESYR